MKKGIDVYVNDGVIDWKKVKEDDVYFAMIKATQGYLVSNPKSGFVTDSKFKTNIENASANGIKCGAYHYLMAKTVEDAKKEAAYFISVIKPYKDKINLFAGVDMENDKAKKYSKDEKKLNTDILIAFCAEIEKAGFDSIIYINPNFIKNYLEFDRLKDKNIWLAYYTDETTAKDFINKQSDPKQFKIWQYGDMNVAGAKKAVDGDYLLYDDTNIQPIKKPEKKPVKPPEKPTDKIEAGDRVIITGSKYINGKPIPAWAKKYIWIVDKVSGNKVVLGHSSDRKHNLDSIVNIADVEKVRV